MTHAEILANIAKEVVEQHRGECACSTVIFDHPAEGICRGVVGEFYVKAETDPNHHITEHWPDDPPKVDPGWSYTLPERFRG